MTTNEGADTSSKMNFKKKAVFSYFSILIIFRKSFSTFHEFCGGFCYTNFSIVNYTPFEVNNQTTRNEQSERAHNNLALADLIIIVYSCTFRIKYQRLLRLLT